MSRSKSTEKRQSVWSLAIAVSVTIAIFSPQEIVAQNEIAQGLLDTIETSITEAMGGERQ